MKRIRISESTISIILGALVIIVVGILVVNYYRGTNNTPYPQPGPAPISKFTEKENCLKLYGNSTLNDTPNKCIKYFLEGGE